MLALSPVVLAAVVIGALAAAVALSVTVVVSLRGGESRVAARRLAPLTVSPAIAAFLLGGAALGGTVPTVVPLGGVALTIAALVGPLRSLWRTAPARSDSRTTAHPAD